MHNLLATLFHDTFTGVYKILFDLRLIMPATMNTTPTTTIVTAITDSTMPATAPGKAKLTVVCTSQHLICSLCCHTMYTGVWITIVWIVMQVRSEATRGAVCRMHYCIPEWHITHYWLLIIGLLFLPPGCTLLVWPAGPKIAYVFCTCLFVCWFFCWCIPIYHVCNNYITYIVACNFTLVNFGQLLRVLV